MAEEAAKEHAKRAGKQMKHASRNGIMAIEAAAEPIIENVEETVKTVQQVGNRPLTVKQGVIALAALAGASAYAFYAGRRSVKNVVVVEETSP